MKRILILWFILTSIVFASPSLQLDKERIESGQTFNLLFIVPLQEIPEAREIPKIETRNGFEFLGIDSVDQVMRPGFEDMFNSFFGGGSRAYKARIYKFNLKAPKKTGQIEAGQISWEINGVSQIIQNRIPINIEKSFSDNALAVSLMPSKKTIYEGEQFLVTLGFHTFDHFEGGLQATDMNTGNDFIVYRGDLSGLEFKPVPNTRREMEAQGKFAWLAPTKSGTLQIPPFKFKYTKRGEPKVVEEKKQMGNMSFSSRTVKQESIEAEASTPTINITVKPLPSEGKPADFSGMVGDYKFSANFDKTNLKVGEALTLSIFIKGDGSPGTITEPKLPDFSEFRTVPPENNITKKIVNNKVITTKDIKVFLYPKKKGTFEIPAINYSWFNPSKKKYESISAGPWQIIVEKNDANAESIFQNPTANPNIAVKKQNIEDLGKDIRYIHSVDNKSNFAMPYKSFIFWILFLSAIPCYGIISYVIANRRKRNNNIALIRKEEAKKLLKEKFANARTALQKNDGKAFFAALENGLIDYLSNLTNLEFNGMTRSQMNQKFEELNLKSETASAINKWLDKCAFVRFAPVSASIDEQKMMLTEVEKLCEGLEILK